MAARANRRIDPDEDEEEAEARRAALSTSAQGSPNSLVVGLDCRSMNLYRFLRVRFPRQPHGELRRWIGAALVRVNGSAVTDSRPLRFGDVVEIDADVERTPRRPAPPRLAAPAVLYRDAALLAVDKPSGLSTAGERSSRRPHLLALLRVEPARSPGVRARLVHRIDKQASGVVVFALDREAQRALHEEFAARRVEKDYLALVSGHVDDAPQRIEIPLARRRGREQQRTVAPGRGRPAVTLVRALLRFRGYTLVHARPLTGRTHQIRVHLRHLGHPIVGDATYGGEERLLLSRIKLDYRPARGESERPLLDRLALHAYRIRLRSPAGGAPVACVAPLPKDLRTALKQLQKTAATRIVPDFDSFLADPLGLARAGDPFSPDPSP